MNGESPQASTGWLVTSLTYSGLLSRRLDPPFSTGGIAIAAAGEQQRIKRQQMRKNDLLTSGTDGAILPSAGEAEASVAGEQLARDNRSGCDGHPSWGAENTGSPTLHAAPKDIQSIPHAFSNSDLPEASRHLTGEGDLSNLR